MCVCVYVCVYVLRSEYTELGWKKSGVEDLWVEHVSLKEGPFIHQRNWKWKVLQGQDNSYS